jgi:hypothetical protein
MSCLCPALNEIQAGSGRASLDTIWLFAIDSTGSLLIEVLPGLLEISWRREPLEQSLVRRVRMTRRMRCAAPLCPGEDILVGGHVATLDDQLPVHGGIELLLRRLEALALGKMRVCVHCTLSSRVLTIGQVRLPVLLIYACGDGMRKAELLAHQDYREYRPREVARPL